MKKILSDRRLFLATFGLLCLTFLGCFQGAEVAMAISTVVLSICAANASEKIFKKESENDK